LTNHSLGTTTVVQVGIVVRDIEAKASAWAQLLGLPMPDIIVTDPADVAHTEYQDKPSSAQAKLAFLHTGQVDLELIEPIGTPSTWQDHLDAHGDSVHHIAFNIRDMQEKLTFLSENGISLVQWGDYTGGRYAYVDSVPQLGIILELLEND
jgi:catechol 2,3-dioxygenase-like lactoylglutathione lyase family enzyme